MGRQSAGKWIRNLILGKKSSSKSDSSKNQDILKASSNKDVVMVVVSSEAPMSHPNLIVTTVPPSSSAKIVTKGTVSENEVVNGSSIENVVVIANEDGKANAEAQDAAANDGSENHVEKINLTDAAIIVQAALRGYQARRKFKMLKGFIPLQGLIRGKLGRTEAVSALYCVNGIVKVQALARGYRVRHSAAIGLQMQKSFNQLLGGVASTKPQKISDSVFVQKLLASSPAVLSRKLNYEWLERWTRSRFWAPLPELKKIDESLSDERNVLGQRVECDEGKGKRNARKGEAVDDGLILKKESSMALHSSAKENEKRKQDMTRKSSDHAKKLAVSKSKESDVENHSNNFQRRASLPANYFKNNESPEKTNTPPRRVPSYMAPTESAKAKLRGQESPRFGSDLVFERNGINRRLSLSCSLNGKLGLVSPRSARFGNIASSKGMPKADNRSLSTSVSDKLIQPQPQWRRYVGKEDRIRDFYQRNETYTIRDDNLTCPSKPVPPEWGGCVGMGRINKSLDELGSESHQGQGRPHGSMSAYRGTYRSPTNKVLTSTVGFELTTLWVMS
ncbi:IQ-domain [Stylosanthes scabra]|uniref:IQ-domain n=1 Tax=Stylosanthes scabra TaxID=79078 RepID=A0ABU6Z863_9FABA|nr:IQ-domain [Stylosanthes scabra]